MIASVQQVVNSFNALSEADKHQAAFEILRHLDESTERHNLEAALVEAADELFRTLDAEEAGHASR